MPIWRFQDPSALQALISDYTSEGIVVELENHYDSNGAGNGGSQGDVYTGTLLAQEQAWYTSIAKAFANNPYVWFGTKNEPPYGSGSALSDWQLATYNSIRGAGNNNPVMIEALCDPNNLCNTMMVPSDYSGMKNVLWDMHYYNWFTGSSDAKVNQDKIDALAASTQKITSADGVMPVLIGEYGNSTDGSSIDSGGDATVQAV